MSYGTLLATYGYVLFGNVIWELLYMLVRHIVWKFPSILVEHVICDLFTGHHWEELGWTRIREFTLFC